MNVHVGICNDEDLTIDAVNDTKVNNYMGSYILGHLIIHESLTLNVIKIQECQKAQLGE